MRVVTTDEVGLVKFTTLPATTVIHGRMDRSGGISHVTTSCDGILLARVDGRIEVVDDQGEVIREWKVENKVVGIGEIEGTVVVCTEKGSLHIYPHPTRPSSFQPAIHSLPSPIHTACIHSDPPLLAIGGKDLNLHVYSLPSLDPVFKAKNPPNTQLNQPVRTFTTCIAVTKGRYVLGTGFGEVWVYDPQKSKRPVMHRVFDRHPVRALAFSGNHVVVSDTTGQVVEAELDGWKITRKMKCAGAITALQIVGSQIVSGGLDRFLRVFEEGKCVSKVYLKQRLTGLVVWDDEEDQERPDGNEGGRERNAGDEEQEEADEDVWDAIPKVEEDRRKRKKRRVQDANE